MAAIEERIVDRHVLKLLRALLRAGVMEDGAIMRSVTGTPQGGVSLPLLQRVCPEICPELRKSGPIWAHLRAAKTGKQGGQDRHMGNS